MIKARPYLGLRPYEFQDRDNFFGRDADCEILLGKLLVNRLTLLFAASGVGKTSLLNAAVLPRLRDPLGENLTVVYHNDWVFKPITALENAIREAVPSTVQAPERQTLAELISFSTLFIRHPFVIVLDQFEEFFRYQRGKPEFDEVIHQLTTVILNPDIPVSLVLSMREDFALELNAFKQKLAIMLFENYYRLEQMKLGAAEDAIVEPAAKLDFVYETLLLESLVHDLSTQQHRDLKLPHQKEAERERYVDPAHLQIVCEYLWQQNQTNSDKILRFATYEKAGKAKGIIEQFLNTVLRGFSTAEKNIVSKAFDYLAAQKGVKVAYPASTLAKIIKVDENKLACVLDKLARGDVRILRKKNRENILWYELYHDMFSPSIERWNNEWKDKRLRKQRWISGSLGVVLLAGSALLVDSFMWVLNNKFPVEELFTEQRYRLISWGLMKPPFPEMVNIPMPKGEVRIGELNTAWYQSLPAEFLGSYGSPVVDLTIKKPFQAGISEVTYRQYDYYIWQVNRSNNKKEKKLRYPVGAFGTLARGNYPVTNVSWHDARHYAIWLSSQFDRQFDYYLPTEAEWEYVARGTTTTEYWWGDLDPFGTDAVKANCENCGTGLERPGLSVVKNYPKNHFEVHDTAGNVWEWTCSEYRAAFDGNEQSCLQTSFDEAGVVIRGGSWRKNIGSLRSSSRASAGTKIGSDDIGFRVFRMKN